jgi:ATP-dependent DNA helicase RecQ
MKDSAQLHAILKKYFGFDSFRGEQEKVIHRLVQGEDALVVMPTGFGKSLCYQLPAAILHERHRESHREPHGGHSGVGTSQGPRPQGLELVLVLSPLIALMEDQVLQARRKGLQARAIHSGMDKRERDRVLRELRQEAGTEPISLLYVTPERFRKSEFLEVLKGIKVSLLAVDEAHCISLWGHDFRPDYSKLGAIRKLLGNPTTVALTATATPRVQDDILNQLDLPQAFRFLGGIERPELALQVHDLFSLESKLEKIEELRQHVHGPVLVYWSLIGTLEKALAGLRRRGHRIDKYHGQMAPADRRRAQEEFLHSESAMLFATPAFGLGIDKPNIRCVIHGELPISIESYYQEVGRAGRDRQPAEGHLLFDEDDVSIAMDFIKWSCPEPAFVRKVYQLVNDRKDEYRAGGADYLRQEMNFYNSRDFRVETSLNQLERAGCLEWTGKFFEVRDDPSGWEEDLFSPTAHQQHLRSQNEKLLAMLRWAKQDEGCRMQTIYVYFGHHDPEPCGVCDLCREGLGR